MPFKGSCHCGAIRFTVDEDPPAKGLNAMPSAAPRGLHHFTRRQVPLETPLERSHLEV